MQKKIGVYICRGCGIGDAIDTDKLAGIAVKKYKVSVCKTHDFLCGPDGLSLIRGDIEGNGINTIVIAGCSPRVKYEEFNFPGKLVERVNIREFVAWSQPPKEKLTQALAEDYLRMGIVKAQKADLPVPYLLEEISRKVLVVGGGITGLTAALGVADAGYDVVLVERSSELGGWAKKFYKQLPLRYPFDTPESPTIGEVINKVKAHPRIEVLTSSEIEKTSGFPGQFTVLIRKEGAIEERKVGAIIVAAGWRPYDASKLTHLGYGKPNVITSIEMEELACREGRIKRPSDGKEARRVAFILCAGSRDENHLPYCSSVCCLTSLKQATYIRERNPGSIVYILYKDIRTMGLYEFFYKKIQADPGIMLTKGEVVGVTEGPDGNLFIDLRDTLLGEEIRVEADMVVLAIGMVPNTRIEPEVFSEWERRIKEEAIAKGYAPPVVQDWHIPNILKLEYRQGAEIPTLMEAYGFVDSNFICFPYETRRTGIYVAGSIRQPMTMLSCIEDAMGAALKAIQCIEAVASGHAVHPRSWDYTYPEVYLPRCTACRRCTEECPFGAIDEDEKGLPLYNPTRCRRCGTCLGACPERIVSFKDCSIDMISSMVRAIDMPPEEIRIVALVCENDAYPALDTLGLMRKKLNPLVRFIPVACLGRLNLVWIADFLSAGIDGVLMLGCKFGENYQCHFILGSEMANYRLGKVQETLDRLRLESGRVQFVQISIDEYDKLQGIIDEFVQRVEKIGPNPFKEFI